MVLTLHAHRADGSRRAIQIDERDRLASGGEGAVYAVRHDPRYVVKTFAQPDAARAAKVKAMIAAAPSGSAGRHIRLAWPEAIVADPRGRFLGFMMPRIDESRCVPLDWYLLPAQRKAERLRGESDTDYGFRLTIARNLAAVLAGVHMAGHALVDLKPPNILVDREHGTVVIVDCDGACIAGPDRMHPAMVATEEYLAPEFHGKVQNADYRQDRFALAVVVFRLLNDGLYPTNGTPLDSTAPASHVARIKAGLFTVNPAARMIPHPGSLQAYFADATLDLLRCGLSASAILRPPAKDWQRHLETLLKQVRPCPAGRHVALPKGCPWCGEAPTVPAPTIPPRPAAVHAALVPLPPRAGGAKAVLAPLSGAMKARVATAVLGALLLVATLAAIASRSGWSPLGHLSERSVARMAIASDDTRWRASRVTAVTGSGSSCAMPCDAKRRQSEANDMPIDRG